MIKKAVVISFLTLYLSSCSGMKDGYNNLTIEQKNSVIPYNKDLPLSRDYIYKVNASELLETLKDYPKAFVYIYTPGCANDASFPLTVYERYAKKNGYKVFFVLSSYKRLQEGFAEPVNEPLFVINSDYYGKKFLGGYVSHFENELKGLDLKDKTVDIEGSLHFFENGIYKKTYLYLPSSQN